ncbi:DNA photolyase family protein [Glutamicibacter sp. MNS18]|uniref:cryptochrome/photolyase family protein n=1 Tax=Glutamicibacter sp. MNS18 TaxID=2989817 RepID=UPI00223618D8|nr:deoxyribodipyrimidine photo-lyase [Glutamicibacter sp. MNS18]MCW4466107.1 DNA photolyase family protein [Glutamicibacter sp. MNS18]
MNTATPLNLVWFRDDLRVEDHPALHAAMLTGPSVAIYVLDETSDGVRLLGAAARWWLHHALQALHSDLAALGVPLLLMRGSANEVLQRAVRELGAAHLHLNRRYAAAEREIDAAVATGLGALGCAVHSHEANLLAEPGQVLNGQGEPYKVFAAFHRRILELESRPLVPVPREQTRPRVPATAGAVDLEQLQLLPTGPDWSAKLAEHWIPGEAAARARLDEVVRAIAGSYAQHHDRPDLDGTARLSAALRWGHLSPVQVFEALTGLLGDPTANEGAFAMRRQVIWRDFCWHLLAHFPHIPERNFRPEFDAMDWAWPQDDPQAADEMRAWQRGMTGYGLVDAGMRQLWDTGWMHNRVRMVTASFLVKNLLIHWKAGEQWFWDTLVDADLACNTVNWQWVAGSGTDAAPYFRVFNPELQARNFDPNGSYVAHYAPLGSAPIVDLKESRLRTLEAYANVTARRQGG